MPVLKPLSGLKAGSKASVVRFEPCISGHFSKLAAFGILPGADITIIQTSPVIVVEVGFTRVAIDKMLAAAVIVAQ